MRGQAERLVPMCQAACDQADISFGDLDAVAVTIGPGTFTGVRIGLATAKGLALALGLPLVGVSTLTVVAQSAAAAPLRNKSLRGGKSQGGRMAVALDARRSEVYFQLFDVSDGHVIPASEPAAVLTENIGKYLDSKVTIVVGSGANLFAPYLAPEIMAGLDFPDFSNQPHASTLAYIGAKMLKAGDVPDKVMPLYLRAPDAVPAKAISYAFQNQ